MANEIPDQAPIAELEYEPGAFELAFAKHKSKLILVTVLAGVAALSYYGMKLWKDHADRVSGEAFSKAESIEDFRKVAKDFASKNAGGSALLMAAQLLAQEGKPTEAIAELTNFLKAYPGHPLADLATLRLADANLQNGATAEAKTQLAAVAEKFPKSPHAPLALLRLGDLFAADKDLDKAKETYLKSKTNYPGNPYFDQATQHQEALTQAEPAKVPFVPEPAAPVPGSPPGAPSLDLSIPGLNPNAPEESTGLEINPEPAPEAPAPKK